MKPRRSAEPRRDPVLHDSHQVFEHVCKWAASEEKCKADNCDRGDGNADTRSAKRAAATRGNFHRDFVCRSVRTRLMAVS
ncbi:MAG: hypothetical protein NVSMB64_16010 [Candidatus Velthaea sp.]